ncbi:MAG: hypothetical protein ACR2IA_07690 [Pyrinomonadaceae bacterium]
MRKIAFLVTLFLGVYVVSFFKTSETTPCLNFGNNFSNVSGAPSISLPKGLSSSIDTSRNYSFQEAEKLIGKQVRNRSNSNAKCPKTYGNCLELFTGENGKVVNILPSVNDSYLIEIKWNSKWNEPDDSFVTYAGKELSFEIVD